MRTPTPEHDKLLEHKEEHDTVSDFCMWLQYHPELAICRTDYNEFYDEYDWIPLGSDAYFSRLIAEYFGINYDDFMREKDNMLAEIRKIGASNG